MKIPDNLLHLGLTQYEMKAYLALIGRYPVNGSQLSRRSGVPRARIYDVLLSLKNKGIVVETGNGQYAPLPPQEFIKRIRDQFEISITSLENRLQSALEPILDDYVWTIRGYENVIAKAQGMIGSARQEVYIRVFPDEAHRLKQELSAAEKRGARVKYISMGKPSADFQYCVIHPESEKLEVQLGGRSFDLVVDKTEILVGMFEKDLEDRSPINWAKNHWFVIATRDSLRHDFFHYFLHKIHEKKEKLSPKEQKLYRLIANDY